MATGLILVLIVGALGYLGIIYTSPALILLAICSGVMLFLGYGYILYMMLRVKCRIQIPIVMAEQEEGVMICAVTENRSRLPLPKVVYRMDYRNSFGRKKRILSIQAAADAKSSSRMNMEVAAKSSGNYTFRLVRVRFYGLLGIGYLTRYVRYEERLSIMPKITPVMIEVGLASRYFQGEAEVYDDKTGGDDVSEVFQIRSFQPGDKIQNIHWKLSAKEDELMVRENSLPMGCPVVILLDISGGQKETEKQRNHFFEMVISISFGLVEKQCPHYIAWYDEKEHDLIRVRVDKEERVYYFILLLYGAVQSREKMDIALLYQEKYRGETAVTKIEMNLAGKLIVAGTEIEDFAKAEIRV